MSFVIAILPVLPGFYLLREFEGIAVLAGWSLILLSFAAEIFVIWRASRLARATFRRSGRMYERSGRYALPPEYADSEDAYLASRRRRKTTPPLR
jgi:hypothetical protein